MTLNSREQQILHAALLNGMMPAKDIASLSGHPEHTVRKDLASLQKRGIITPYTLVNQFKLGWLKVGVYFSFNTGQAAGISGIIERLVGYDAVTSVVELFGRYQFFMSLNVESLFHAESFLEKLREQIAGFDIEHDFSLRRRLTLFKRKYLCPDEGDRHHLSYAFEADAADLDPAATKILNAINTGGGFPNAMAIAEAIGMPHSTVHSKIKALEKKGVIVGYSYSVDPLKIGRTSYDLLIRTSVRSDAFRTSFFDFCAGHPFIVGLTDCIGRWQYEIRIEAPSPSDANELTQDVLDNFRDEIHEFEIVSICREIKYMRTASLAVPD